MSNGGPVMSSEQFAARLVDVHAQAGSATGYEAAVTALAHDLQPVRWSTVLKIGRAGLPDEAAVYSTARGREAALAEELWDWLIRAGYDRADPGDLGLVVPAYVALPAREDFDDAVGRGSSLDAHTLCMLVVERVLEPIGTVEVDERAETWLFRWLHGRARPGPNPEQLAHVASRRHQRLEMMTRPAGEVAASLCSSAPPAGWLDRVLERMLAGPYSTDQLEEMLEQFVAADGVVSTRWEDCRRGFAVGGEIDVTASEPADSAYLHGLLLRWLVEQGVPVTVDRIRWAESYTRYVLAFLAPHPSRAKRNTALQAHCLALVALRRESPQAPPLAEELILVAWLCHQQRLGLDVGAFLGIRTTLSRALD